MVRLVALLFLSLCLPAYAHEGSAGEHLLLGLDTGILYGIAIGFIAGAISTAFYLKRSNRS